MRTDKATRGTQSGLSNGWRLSGESRAIASRLAAASLEVDFVEEGGVRGEGLRATARPRSHDLYC